MASLHVVSEKFVTLVFDKQYDEADAVLREQREAVSRDQVPRLIGVEDALRNKVGQLGCGPAAQRRILAGSYAVAWRLKRQEYWNEAEAIYREVIELSLAMKEAFFLNDARLSRAVCLKNLGRTREYEQAKAELPAGYSDPDPWA